MSIGAVDFPPPGQKNTGQDCLLKVHNAYAELGVGIPDDVIERGYRVWLFKF